MNLQGVIYTARNRMRTISLIFYTAQNEWHIERMTTRSTDWRDKNYTLMSRLIVKTAVSDGFCEDDIF